MLYKNFIFCIMTVSAFALLDMINNQAWQYIILPIGIILWGIFKFFDDNDRDFLIGKGIDPDEYNAFFPDLYEDNYSRYHRTSTYSKPKRSGNTVTWEGRNVEDNFDSNLYSHGIDHDRYKPKNPSKVENPLYKGMKDKCKRNFVISVEE